MYIGWFCAVDQSLVITVLLVASDCPWFGTKPSFFFCLVICQHAFPLCVNMCYWHILMCLFNAYFNLEFGKDRGNSDWPRLLIICCQCILMCCHWLKNAKMQKKQTCCIFLKIHCTASLNWNMLSFYSGQLGHILACCKVRYINPNNLNKPSMIGQWQQITLTSCIVLCIAVSENNIGKETLNEYIYVFEI